MANTLISSFLSYGEVSDLGKAEELVYNWLKANRLHDKSDVSNLSNDVGMSHVQVRSAMFLLLHKGLLRSDEIINEA